jgi:hypothetical protein
MIVLGTEGQKLHGIIHPDIHIRGRGLQKIAAYGRIGDNIEGHFIQAQKGGIQALAYALDIVIGVTLVFPDGTVVKKSQYDKIEDNHGDHHHGD